MFYYCCTVLGVLTSFLAPSSSQRSQQCIQSASQFSVNNPGTIPEYCSEIQERFNNISYRIDLTEQEVGRICDSSICQAVTEQLTLPCIHFAKKDISCLDSPALMRVWCSNSDRNNDTKCYTSLTNQGVINSPSLLMPCLNASYNAESCTDYCRDLLMNADCCFVSYYAFMIDEFAGSRGSPVYENHTMFMSSLWNWCNLTSPGVCSGVNLNDISTRNNNVTCQPQPTESASTIILQPTQSPDVSSPSNGGAIIQKSLVGFRVLIMFVLTIMLISYS